MWFGMMGLEIIFECCDWVVTGKRIIEERLGAGVECNVCGGGVGIVR
jgi:hypothetical protein